jgi:predicted kinase
LASGKTTLARQLAETIPAVLICEDEWLSTISDGEIKSLEEYLKYSARLRKILTSHIRHLLNLGVSVVLDFPSNRPQDRQWVRSMFESANADHVLHVLLASDLECKKRLKQRNENKPEGLYWATVTEGEFEAITKYFVPPTEEEGFRIVIHDQEK